MLMGDGVPQATGQDTESDDASDEADEEDETEGDGQMLQAFLTTLESTDKDQGIEGADDEEGGEGKAGGKKRVQFMEHMSAFPESEFHVSAAQNDAELTLDDLLGEEGATTSSILNPKEKRMAKKVAPLAAPVPGRVQARMDREAGYEQSKEELTRWDPMIQKNRQADHLFFPYHNDASDEAKHPGKHGSIASLSLGHHVAAKAQNAMEAEVQALLGQSKGFATEREVGQGEELEMKHLSVEDAKARRQELRQLRELAFREEKKAARVKKIKSKAYHRIKKRAKMRIQGMDGEEGDEEDEAEKALLDRAKERMTLRHKRVGKWAKGALMRTAEGREAVMEEMRLGEELRRRIEHYGDDDADDGEGGLRGQEEEDEAYLAGGADQSAKGIRERAGERIKTVLEEGEADVGKVGKGSKLLEMAFMKKAARAKDQESRMMMEEMMREEEEGQGEFEEDEEEREGGKRVGGNVGRRVWGQEGSGKDKAALMPTSAHSNQGTKKDATSIKVEEESLSIKETTKVVKAPKATNTTENPWLVGNKDETETGMSKGRVRVIGKKKEANAVTLQLPTMGDQVKDGPEEGDKEPKWDLTHTGSGGRKTGGVLLGEQKALVERAFAGDGDVVEQEFLREKEEAVGQEVDGALGKKGALLQDSLPGWGSWGGRGVKKQDSRKRKNAFDLKREEAKAEREAEGEKRRRGRKDARLKDVHISEKRQRTTLSKYSVDKVPFPFKTREQYERSLTMPLGKEWNAQQAHQELVLPRVITKAGRVINPLERTEESTRR
ncbi:small-subunit processome [Piptocephalis cylindrospora]|uniref:Small-subunit processome n=1 Tax=Piptocephalis cylindrospora TaxID=1907219 RepID=A0A4P9Y6D9_9FUNG|nr:small-subunit processome [Piptocephalis cylindrospora]|eukprot:RKP13801.1 small-subunit processome [Piptocephalis cylindrospora]